MNVKSAVFKTEAVPRFGILTRHRHAAVPNRHAAVPKPLSKDARHARLARSLSRLDAAAGRCLRVRDCPFLFTAAGRAERRVDPVPRFVTARCCTTNRISQNVWTTARCGSARVGRFAQTFGRTARDTGADHRDLAGVVLEAAAHLVRASALGDGISGHDPLRAHRYGQAVAVPM